jgi:hypothetical protein
MKNESPKRPSPLAILGSRVRNVLEEIATIQLDIIDHFPPGTAVPMDPAELSLLSQGNRVNELPCEKADEEVVVPCGSFSSQSG